jgi:hypothetical protein
VTTDALKAKIHSIRKYHSAFGVYTECGHEHTEDDLDAGRCIEVDDVGLVCKEGLLYKACYECDTDEGYVREDVEDAHWPCEVERLANALEVAIRVYPNTPYTNAEIRLREAADAAVLAALEGK